MKFLFSLLLSVFFLTQGVTAQTFLTKNIKSFGAKGDGKTNDHAAFEKAATFFNKRGGNGKLIIPSGTYIIGFQEYTGNQPKGYAYTGKDVLHFDSVKNFTITGTSKSVLKYQDSLRFGTFDPKTKMIYSHGRDFYDASYAAVIGHCIYFDNCINISINNLNLDGNSDHIIQGGGYGDVGTQLQHYGIFIKNSRKVSVSNVNAHHFGCDGICVCNVTSAQKDEITFTNSKFEYNARQGFSFVGGNDLHVKNCSFNHTGKGKFSSPPGAGVDIEAEIGPVANGVFERCEFVNNSGCGLTAVNGSNCTFNDCTFWGVTSWSAWVTTPAFTFTRCRFYGSTVWAYNSPDEENATKYFNCTFEDKPYKGIEPYGNFLIENNETKRVSYTNCTFIVNKKRPYWLLITSAKMPEEKYQLNNCTFILKNQTHQKNIPEAFNNNIVAKNSFYKYSNNVTTQIK